MKFETLKTGRNKKVFIGVVAVILISIAIIASTSLAKYKVTQSINIVKGVINYAPYDISVVTKLLVNDNKTIELEELPISENIALSEVICTNGATLKWNVDTKTYEIANLSQKGSKCEAVFALLDTSNSQVFDYTGKIEEYTVANEGNYLLEVWGAEGGSGTNSYGTRIGGYGGYAKGVANLSANTTLFIGVGGRGVNGASTSVQTGGYNGGGAGQYHGGSGGGATHIATSTGLLSTLENAKDSVLIVAGGGGGGAVTNDGNCSDGGHGGGISGTDSTVNACYGTIGEPYNGYGTGGTQDSGGTQSANNSSNLGSGGTGSFGLGATTNLNTNAYGAGGGGGGYYGGGSSTIAGAGGGSGYIGSSKLLSYGGTIKSMYCYNCTPSSDEDTLTYSIKSASATAESDIPKTGDGYAKITYLNYKPYAPEFDMKVTKENTSLIVTINISSDNLFETSKYYYSINGGDYIESSNNTHTFSDLDYGTYTVKTYIVDSKNVNSEIKMSEIIIPTGISINKILAEYTKSTRTDFSTVYTATTTKTIFSEEDDDGTSYYFAGAPTDNWVKFAGYYWRIIRINGDGTIRLIYNGTTTTTTGSTTEVASDKFNDNLKDPSYVGYMYEIGNVHGLVSSSKIKEELDNWYENNLITYEDYFDANAGFCGDRTVFLDESGATSGGGTGTTLTYYGAYIRLATNKIPSLKCENSNDLYTMNNSSKGNKSLSYPIGLISADEIAFAGGVFRTNNTSYYLYTNKEYWTISPYYFYYGDTYGSVVFYINTSGAISTINVNGLSYGIRPVINLRSDVTFTGSGTNVDPFVVEGAE